MFLCNLRTKNEQDLQLQLPSLNNQKEENKTKPEVTNVKRIAENNKKAKLFILFLLLIESWLFQRVGLIDKK